MSEQCPDGFVAVLYAVVLELGIFFAPVFFAGLRCFQLCTQAVYFVTEFIRQPIYAVCYHKSSPNHFMQPTPFGALSLSFRFLVVRVISSGVADGGVRPMTACRRVLASHWNLLGYGISGLCIQIGTVHPRWI